jgi:hypothetical protein
MGIPRSPAPQPDRRYVVIEKKSNWLLWTFLGALAVGVAVLVVWRLQYQENHQKNDEKVLALLESADQLILANRENEAEAVVSQGIGLIPGDTRCQAMIDRINTKRKMILKNQVEASNAALTSADQYAKTDIVLAIEALEKVVEDNSLTAETHLAAEKRIAELKGSVCSLRMPKDWPRDANVTIGHIAKEITDGQVTGITPGKHTILASRFGFRDPPAVELEFRGTDPVQLPIMEWKLRGAKVYVKSRPSGAAVWWRGKDTGKVTPCEILDVDDGPVEFLLKHPDYVENVLKGEVKDRQPLSITATLKPSDGSSP